MNRIAIFSLFTLIALLVPVNLVYAVPSATVTICHATSSESNPWVRIVTNENATSGHFDENGTPNAGHEEDLLFQGEVECPTPPVVPEFGLIPGAIAALVSGGAFLLMKRRALK